MSMNMLLQWSPFMPPAGSTVASQVDNLYGFIFWLSVVFFILVIGPGAWFIYKYRVKKGEKAGDTPRITHNTTLELLWSVIPLILVMIIAVWGFYDYMTITVAPADATEIYVTGYKWGWRFEHKDGFKELNQLHVPIGRPIKLILTSEDVIHSFFVPDFRIKQDLPPGRYTSVWFEPTDKAENVHQIFCTEYCGDGHSGMLGKIFVWPEKKIEQLKREGDPDFVINAENGAKVYKEKNCITCHTVNGDRLTGPSFKGIWGSQQPLADGTAVPVDENYVKESILQPMAKVAQGYTPVMPSYQGLINEKEIKAVIEYLKTLK